MEKEKIDCYEYFLNRHTKRISEGRFLINQSDEFSRAELINEFKKFVDYISLGVMTQNGIFLTVINSYCLVIESDTLNYFCKLYSNLKKASADEYVNYMSVFLLTYWRSINSNKYKTDIPDNKLVGTFANIFKNEMVSIKTNSLLFYNKLAEKLESEKIDVISAEKTKRIFMDLATIDKNYSGLNAYKKIFNYLLKLRLNLAVIIDYDAEIQDNSHIYCKYIFTNIKNLNCTNDVFVIIEYLGKKELLTDRIFKIIINNYIDLTNKKLSQFEDKEISFIEFISDVDRLLNIFQKLKNYNNKMLAKHDYFKEKINVCTKRVLYLKRVTLNNEEYVNSDMKTFTSSFQLKKEDAISTCDEILMNKMNIYSFVGQDFDKYLKLALHNYSDFPIQHLFNTYIIDSNNGVYSKKVQMKAKSWKSYYDKKGLEYSNSNSELANKLEADFYYVMIKYVRKNYFLYIQLLLEQFRMCELDIISIMREYLNKNFKNAYSVSAFKNTNVFIPAMIINIESFLFDIGEKLGKNTKNLKIEELLEDLFNDNIEEEEIRNGLMFINFILYEKEGMNLRNKFMHGELVDKKDHTAECVMVGACLLFLIRFYIKKIGEN